MSPAIAEICKSVLLMEIYLDRHQLGNWDDSEEDIQSLNQSAIATKEMVISRFNTPFGIIKIVTNKRRDRTLVLFDHEEMPDF